MQFMNTTDAVVFHHHHLCVTDKTEGQILLF